jgi:hypothetical protein
MAQPAAALRAFPQAPPDSMECHQLAKAWQQMLRPDGNMPAILATSRLQRSPSLAGLGQRQIKQPPPLPPRQLPAITRDCSGQRL